MGIKEEQLPRGRWESKKNSFPGEDGKVGLPRGIVRHQRKTATTPQPELGRDGPSMPSRCATAKLLLPAVAADGVGPSGTGSLAARRIESAAPRGDTAVAPSSEKKAACRVWLVRCSLYMRASKKNSFPR